MSDRYESDPTRRRGRPDIVEYIKDLSERLRTAEVGLRIGHTAIEDGDLVVLNGDIRVGETDGTTVLRILHGETPEIRFFPLGSTDDYLVAMYGFDFDSGFGTDQAIQIDVEQADGLILDGGKLLLTKRIAVLSHQPDSGEETYVWVNADPANDEVILFRGRMKDSIMYDDRQMFYAGTISVSSGFSTWTHSYAATWGDQILPVLTVNNNGATIQWNLDSFTISGFTVRFSSTVSGKNINFFNVRCS